MFFQYIKLNHLQISTERLFLSQIRYKQKVFLSKVTNEKMQLRSFLVCLSRDDTELVVSVPKVDFIYMFLFYKGSTTDSNLTEDIWTLTFLILQTPIKLMNSSA